MTLPRFFLAVDESSEEAAFAAIKKIREVKGDFGVKVNLDLVINSFSIIRKVRDYVQRSVFVDMKMWNGQRTMNEVIKAIAAQGGAMVNVYALADSMLDKAVATAKKERITILGLTILTHYDEEYCMKFFKRSLSDTVSFLAEVAMKRGCDGYILPGTCLGAVKGLGGIKFNPAVRPAWFEDKKANAQEQIMEPNQAIKQGATIVSCGGPVFKSPNPQEALEKILKEVYSP